MAKELTKKDMADLQAYQAAIREWSGREPERLSAEVWDEVWPEIQATGEVPEAYRDRIGVNLITERKHHFDGDRLVWDEGEQTSTGYYDIVWEAWNAEGVALNKKYHDVIAKALSVAISTELFKDEPAKVSDIIDRLLSDPVPTSQLLLQQYLPMLNGYPTNDLMAMSTTRLEADGFTGKATFTKGGHTITIKDFNDLVGAVGVSAKKVMDTATAYLTMGNFYRGTTVNPTATIPLMEYWRAQGLHVDPLPMDTEEEQRKEQSRVAETIKKLKQGLKGDLENLKRLEWEGQGTGRNRGDFARYSFISSYRVKGTTLYVNFDIDIAKYLVQAYVMQWSPALLRHDNRDPNSYVIGRKLLLQHSMDSNAAAGTDNTLSVKTLLAEAPDIITIEELTAQGRRDWKKKIKEKLELALNKNITTAPLLTRWEYRHPVTGTTYTPETASALSWDEYSKLMVDFVLVEEPDQATRRAARAAEKAAAAQEPPKKKRGRPRKNKTE
ncbi:MAG: hypothetical protein J6N55_11765 [Anaerovibrio sp.]|uniref:hypothetical protein n=1 Tax=Anaerovibrio sp. TaxID=1872532 RepID=UPI001B0DBD8F|nr:hypothetical protein [Anaerovibrio sp.]MBO6246937.1 hypothetical protein [Anaerovibrio sp.]